jgi:hypothetical protein
MKIRDVPQKGSVGENITYLAKFHLLPVGKRIFIQTVQQIVMQRIVSWGRSRDGSGFARGNRSVDTEGFCKSQMTLNSGLRRQRATLGRFRWNGRNSVPGCPRSHPEATLRLCGSQPVGTLRPP